MLPIGIKAIRGEKLKLITHAVYYNYFVTVFDDRIFALGNSKCKNIYLRF
jgi:disulfide oxidoreductase YuzD